MPDEVFIMKDSVDVGQKIGYNYSKMPCKLSQIIAVLICDMIMLQMGMSIAMSTIVNGELMSEEIHSDEKLTLNSSETSWYGSLLLICHPVGSLLSSVIQDKYGRKTCFTLVSIPYFFGWLSLYLANSSTLLYSSSVCLGFAIGLSEAPILTYIGESIEPQMRSSLSSMTVFCTMIGLSATFTLSSIFSWRQMALVYLFFPVVVFLMTTLIIPESPMWLLSKNKIKEATNALCWLRGFTDVKAVHNELNYMLDFINLKNKTEVIDTKKTNKSKYSLSLN